MIYRFTIQALITCKIFFKSIYIVMHDMNQFMKILYREWVMSISICDIYKDILATKFIRSDWHHIGLIFKDNIKYYSLEFEVKSFKFSIDEIRKLWTNQNDKEVIFLNYFISFT